jgi:hypothetical protein
MNKSDSHIVTDCYFHHLIGSQGFVLEMHEV